MNRKTKHTGMRRLNGFLLAASLLLGACSGEESVSDFPQGNIPVCFNGDVPETRAVKEYTEAADLTDIGVFAYFTHNDFDANTATPNFMYNQCVKKQENGMWTYTPAKFWPNNLTDKISFFAYAPYVDETGGNPSFDSQTVKGFPKLHYTVPASEADQTDLLASVSLMNQTFGSNNGTVRFAMKHALTKVAVYVKSNDDVKGKKVTAFSIKGTKKGILTYTDNSFTWSYPSPVETQIFTATATDFAVPEKSTEDNKAELATFFLLPRGAGSTFSITFTSPETTDVEDTCIQTVTLTDQSFPSSSLDKWLQGTTLSYTIGIDKKQLTVTSADVNTNTDWKYGETETVGGIEQ